jgi:hypothetical protein
MAVTSEAHKHEDSRNASLSSPTSLRQRTCALKKLTTAALADMLFLLFTSCYAVSES